MGRACGTNAGEEECMELNSGDTRRKESTRRLKRRWVITINWMGWAVLDLSGLGCRSV
jgi:hypothetical protein